MKPELLAVIGIFFGFIILEILFTGFFSKRGQTRQDGVVELISTGILTLATQPFILFASGYLASLFIPELENAIAHWHLTVLFGLFLLFDDMTQYWWHRLSHSVPALYSLHRPHHEAAYMSIRIVYRNNVFYYLLMPGIWFSGILIYLGTGWVYAGYLVLKMAVIFGAHSDLRWDKPLYQIRWLSGFMWIVERTISTPATHSAHHGKHASDGVTNYKGNYGNLLFFWDVLFGTAKITRQYPQQYGVENMSDTSASEQLFWPVIKTSDKSQ